MAQRQKQQERFGLHRSLLSFQISQSHWHHEHLVSSRASCDISTDLRRGHTSLGDWVSPLWASCLCEYIPRPMMAPYVSYCMTASSSTLTMLLVCLCVIAPFWHLPPSPFPCPFLSPSPRFSLVPHCVSLPGACPLLFTSRSVARTVIK